MRLEGLNALTSFLKRLGGLARSISRTYARAVYLEAVKLAPRKTGRLRRSIRIKSARSGYEIAMGGAEAPYAPYLEFGTRPCIIRARNARALRFELAGEIVYARYVRHPGLKPHRILATALSNTSGDLKAIVDKIFKQL